MTLCDLLRHIRPFQKVRVIGFFHNIDYGIARCDVWLEEDSSLLSCNVNFVDCLSRHFCEITIYDD